MNIQCLDSSQITPPVRYIINFILENCGVFFKWIKNPSDSFLTISYNDAQVTQNKNIIILPKYIDLQKIHEHKNQWYNFKINGTDIPVLGLEEDSNAIIPFDLTASIYYHLACIEELNYQHPDEINKSINERLLYKYGTFKTPVVDILINWFCQIIQSKSTGPISILKSLYPNNEPYGLAITHDVDFVVAYHPVKFTYYKIFHFIGLINREKYNRILDRQKNKWPFAELLTFYSENNIRATFNFIARYTENMHFRYRITSQKMKNLIYRLINLSHEIGLHPSRYIFENISRLKKEKVKLEKASGYKIYGMRHHYLRTLFPFIWILADKNEIAYDSTMAFRDYSGFRAGTSLPFRGFDHQNQKQLKCFEFPTIFFESPLLTNKTDQSLEEMKNLLSVIKANHGMATILWHTNNMESPENYRRIWDHLKEIIKSSDAYIAPLKKHLEWTNFRNNIKITDIEQNSPEARVQIFKPAGFSDFALRTTSKISKIENAEFENQNGVILIKSKTSEQKIILYLRS